jgi:hypothetical protein
MALSRRDAALFGAGATAAVMAGIAPTLAQSGEEAAINAALEELRLGLLNKDKAKLEAVSSANLSYGHSAGRIETKKEFIDAVMARTANVKWLKFTEPKLAVHGNTAIARHFYEQESEADGKSNTIKIGVLQVWQKEDGKWLLYARQAHVLPKT